MFITFEGIDGSGKTTVSNRVAERLRQRGHSICHLREGGEFASPVVRGLREFGKDLRNMTMAPLTELLLYVARDAQLLAESLRPALASGQIVFADRYLYSSEVLSRYGRGLPEAQVRPIIETVAQGLWPDLVVLMDVDPHVARARRKIRKLHLRGQPQAARGGGSRKGLAGAGAQHRFRSGYLDLAAREPNRWLVVDNADPEADLEHIVARVTEAVAQVIAGRPVADVIGSHRSAVVRRRAAGATSYDEASERFFDILEARAVNDPEVAAYFLSGLSDPRAHELRRQLADRAAAVVADGLRGLGDEPSWQLREQLAEVVPFHVARSIEGPAVEGSRAEAMRTRFAGDQPEAVLATLDGIDTRAAWTLRHQLARGRLRAVTGSLRGLDGEEAWALRDSYLAQAGAGEEAVAALALVTRTLSGIATPRAWALRQRCIEVAPSAALWSLEGLNDEASWQMRLAYVGHAPKIVLRTFDGSDDPRGWQMRREHAVRVKEALDSMIGLDHPVAWELREQCADIWPSTVFKSLGAIAGSARGRQLGERLLQQYPDNVSLLKHVTHYAHLASRPTSVRNAG